jgi:hypothetical protein
MLGIAQALHLRVQIQDLMSKLQENRLNPAGQTQTEQKTDETQAAPDQAQHQQPGAKQAAKPDKAYSNRNNWRRSALKTSDRRGYHKVSGVLTG